MLETGIPEHLTGRNLTQLRRYCKLSRKETSPEFKLAAAVHNCFAAMIGVFGCTGSNVRRLMASHEATPLPKHFGVRTAETQRQYKITASQLVVAAYRLIFYGETSDLVALSVEQSDALERIIMLLHGDARRSNAATPHVTAEDEAFDAEADLAKDDDPELEDISDDPGPTQRPTPGASEKFQLHDDLDVAVMDLLQTMILQDLDGAAELNALLPHLTAIMAIQPTGGNFRRPSSVSHDYAALVYLGRLVSLYHAYERSWDEEADGKGVHANYKELHVKYLVNDSNTPVGWIGQLLFSSLGYQRNEGLMANIIWTTDDRAIRIEGQYLELQGLRRMIGGMITELTVLSEELGLEEVRQEVEAALRAGRLVDSMAEHRTDYYFGVDRLHPQELSRHALLDRLLPMMGTKFGHGSGSKAKALDWIAKQVEYTCLLATVVHLVGGQPARATELLSIRNANTELNDRSVVVYDTVVMIWIKHNKNNWRYGKTRPVPRFVPADVGSHLLLLSLVGTPLKAAIRCTALGANVDPNILPRHHTFTSNDCQPVPANTITEVLKKWTAKYDLPVLNVRKSRHVVVAFSKRYMEAALDDDDACAAIQKDNMLDLQAGHSTATASKVYARANDMFAGMDERVLSVCSKLSMALWDMLIPGRGDIPVQPRRVQGFRTVFSEDGRLRADYQRLRKLEPEFEAVKAENIDLQLRAKKLDEELVRIRLLLSSFIPGKGGPDP